MKWAAACQPIRCGSSRLPGRLRRDAERHERHLEPGALGDPHDVAVGEQRGADAEPEPVHGREQRLVERLEHRDEAAVAVELVVVVVGRRHHLAEVLAGGEGPAGAREHDAPQLRIGLRAERARRGWRPTARRSAR